MDWSTICRESVREPDEPYKYIAKFRWGFTCNLLKGHKGEHSPYAEISRQGIVPSDETLSVRAKITKLNEKLRKLNEGEREATKTTLITCLGWSINGGSKDWSGCGSQFPVSQLTYIQTHWYTPPSGCTEGGYWNRGEGQFICPSCGHMNRLYERPEVESLKQFFAKVEDTYDQ
jgi:hypothetical protein